MIRFDFAAAPAVFALQIPTPSLGDHSYVVGIAGRAVVIDPQRDVARFETTLRSEGLSPAAVFETHIHNDYVSGGAVLAGRTGAGYLLPAGSGAVVEHRSVADGEEIPIEAGWSILAMHTPGHTLHHMSYVLVGPDGPAAVFSGGSMLVGAVGRSDLAGPEHTDTLVRQQFHSVHRLADELPDPARVGPTHGAGSFCSASEVTETTTTIGREKLRNPALLAGDVEEFARAQVAGYRLFPAYYEHMGPVNLRGAGPIPTEATPELDVDAVAALVRDGTPVIDVRPAAEWAAGHIPGTISIPFSDDVATYVGWLFEWGAPIAVLGADPHQIDEVELQLARIGHDALAGRAVGLERDWSQQGRSLMTVRVASFTELVAERPEAAIDVRDPAEIEESGAVAGSRTIHVSRVESEMETIPDGTVWVSCASGYRAAIAAGLLEQAGRVPVLVLDDVARYRDAAALR